MDVWKVILDYGLSGVNSTTQSYDKTSEANDWLLYVPTASMLIET